MNKSKWRAQAASWWLRQTSSLEVKSRCICRTTWRCPSTRSVNFTKTISSKNWTRSWTIQSRLWRKSCTRCRSTSCTRSLPAASTTNKASFARSLSSWYTKMSLIITKAWSICSRFGRTWERWFLRSRLPRPYPAGTSLTTSSFSRRRWTAKTSTSSSFATIVALMASLASQTRHLSCLNSLTRHSRSQAQRPRARTIMKSQRLL